MMKYKAFQTFALAVKSIKTHLWMHSCILGEIHKLWMRIHLDLAGHYLGKIFLIISDSYSKWLDIMAMNSISISSLRQSFSTHGLPFIIVTDNGPSFTGNKGNKFTLLLPLITYCSTKWLKIQYKPSKMQWKK